MRAGGSGARRRTTQRRARTGVHVAARRGRRQYFACVAAWQTGVFEFASWCSPCAEETPWVVGFYKKYRSRGLVTLGINELENSRKALDFAKQHGITYPVLVDDGAMGKDYGVIAMPVHVFIDRQGKVSAFRLGEMTPGEIEAAIKKIL